MWLYIIKSLFIIYQIIIWDNSQSLDRHWNPETSISTYNIMYKILYYIHFYVFLHTFFIPWSLSGCGCRYSACVRVSHRGFILVRLVLYVKYYIYNLYVVRSCVPTVCYKFLKKIYILWGGKVAKHPHGGYYIYICLCHSCNLCIYIFI